MAEKNFFKRISKNSESFKRDARKRPSFNIRDIFRRSDEKDSEDRDRHERMARGIIPTEDELEAQRRASFEKEPLFSVIIASVAGEKQPGGPNAEMSLKASTYGRLEVSHIEMKRSRRLGSERSDDEDIPDISGKLKESLKKVNGEYVLIIRYDCVIAPNAFYEAVCLINENPDADVIYSDSDMTDDAAERHFSPDFKPAYNEQLLNCCNYIGDFVLIKTDIATRVLSESGLVKDAAAYDLILKVSELTDRIYHIPKVLVHCRKTPGGVYENEAGRTALEEHLKRQGVKCKVKKTSDTGYYKVMGQKRDFNNLSVIIDSGKEGSDKKINELISLGVTVRSERVNSGTLISLLDTRYGLFVRDASYIPSVDDISEMMELLCRRNVAAVGVKTVDSKGEIVQCGLVYFENGLVRPAFEGMKKNKKGYMRRASLVQYVDGVSFDCVLIRRDALEMTGGRMDMLPKNYLDMDMCLQFKHSGFKVAIDPHVCLEVSEYAAPDEVTENRARLIMRERWSEVLKDGGIFYNPNFRRGNACFEVD